jgi:isocitrate lyase
VEQLNSQDFVAGLGALTGNQAIQEVEAGLDAIYLSGWQVAADANVAGKCTLTNLYIPEQRSISSKRLTMHFTCRPNTGSKRNYRQKKTT